MCSLWREGKNWHCRVDFISWFSLTGRTSNEDVGCRVGKSARPYIQEHLEEEIELDST
jgi:hypothetical protein